MYPDLFGIHDSSYTLMMILGIVAAFLVAFFYLKKKKVTKQGVLDLIICICFAVVLGIVFAVLFENLYEWIEVGKGYKFSFKMTFFGGLLGGVIGFIFTCNIILKNQKFDIKDVVVIAPGAICLGHGFGRIGCFLAGCCHGVETSSIWGMNFPGIGKVFPTQLYEAIFLFILAAILLILAYTIEFKYTFNIYLFSYSIFRFLIEFIRGDERGVAFALSPSQIWCIVLFVFSIPLFFYLKFYLGKKNDKKLEN